MVAINKGELVSVIHDRLGHVGDDYFLCYSPALLMSFFSVGGTGTFSYALFADEINISTLETGRVF
jgi:hypothetical protein